MQVLYIVNSQLFSPRKPHSGRPLPSRIHSYFDCQAPKHWAALRAIHDLGLQRIGCSSDIATQINVRSCSETIVLTRGNKRSDGSRQPLLELAQSTQQRAARSYRDWQKRGSKVRSTLSWWRSATISASSEARDRKSPMTTHQISLSISPMRRSIARFAALR